MSDKKVICMIPARIGSQRFKQKNLALIGNKPLLSYGIEAASSSNSFDDIIVNGDHDSFEKIAKSKNTKYYKRDSFLASSNTKSDDVIFDFIQEHPCSYIIWFNSIAPFQTSKDINGFVDKLINNEFDSLFAVKEEYIQALYNWQPLNYEKENKFSRTQDLNPIQLFIPSMMGWNVKSFRKAYAQSNYGFFCGSTGYYKVSRLTSLVIKHEEDFRMIRSLVEGLSSYNNQIKYYK